MNSFQLMNDKNDVVTIGADLLVTTWFNEYGRESKLQLENFSQIAKVISNLQQMGFTLIVD